MADPEKEVEKAEATTQQQQADNNLISRRGVGAGHDNFERSFHLDHPGRSDIAHIHGGK